MGTIYKISNDINDKVYIGQTVQPLIRRWQSHCSSCKVLDTHFYRAMRLYGIEHFFIEAIELNVPDNLLNEREQYWISYYNSYHNGYNSTIGGDCGSFPTTIIYQYDMDGNYLNQYNGANEAERSTGCLHQNILKACKGILRYCGQYLWSFEKLDKIQIKPDKRYKHVSQYDLNHNWLKTWSSVKEAAQSIGVESTHITRACRTKYSCHGYYWDYNV